MSDKKAWYAHIPEYAHRVGMIGAQMVALRVLVVADCSEFKNGGDKDLVKRLKKVNSLLGDALEELMPIASDELLNIASDAAIAYKAKYKGDE